MNIILGSKSPRRSEILSQAGYTFKIDVIDVDENISDFYSPTDFVKKISRKKLETYRLKYPSDLVICADTIVVVNDTILGKPKDKEDARRMLKILENRFHYVYTAVSISYKKKQKTFLEKTKVYIDKITDEEIEEYISMAEPFDKAGAYAIQGYFSKYIKKIDGDYYNVMGLPINHLSREIKKWV